MASSIAIAAAIALGLIFAWAAVAKTVNHRAWRAALGGYDLPGPARTGAAVAVPAVELAVAVAILAGPVKAGAALALALLAIFSLVVLRAQSHGGDRLPCGCFGRSRVRDYRLILSRNALLAVLAAIALAGPDRSRLVAAAALPDASEVVPAALVVAGIALAAWMAYQVAASLRRKAGS